MITISVDEYQQGQEMLMHLEFAMTIVAGHNKVRDLLQVQGTAI